MAVHQGHIDSQPGAVGGRTWKGLSGEEAGQEPAVGPVGLQLGQLDSEHTY